MSSFSPIYAKTLNGIAALARFQATDPATGSPAVDNLGRPILGEIVQDAVVGAAVGTPADPAYDGVGPGTFISLLKAILEAPVPAGTETIGAVTQADGPWETADANGAAFGGVVPITLGTSFPAGRSIAFVCTVSGNVDLVFADSSVWAGYPLQASPGAVQTLPYAVTKVNPSGSSPATLTAWNLK